MPTTQHLATRLLGGRRPHSVASGQRAAGSGLKKQISGAYSTRLSGICGIVIVSLVAPCVAAVRGVLRMG